MAQQLLDILKQSLSFWRELAILLISISFLRFALKLGVQCYLARLSSKNTYRFIGEGSNRSIEIITHERVQLETLQNPSKSNSLMPVLVDDQGKRVA